MSNFKNARKRTRGFTKSAEFAKLMEAESLSEIKAYGAPAGYVARTMRLNTEAVEGQPAVETTVDAPDIETNDVDDLINMVNKLESKGQLQIKEEGRMTDIVKQSMPW